MVRLSRECLYIDRLTEIAFYGPALFARGVSHFLESHIVQRLIPSMTIRLPAWLGMQTETLQVGRMEFYLATLLLSTGALLLTLFVVT